MLAGALLLVGGASAVGMGFATQVEAPVLASPAAASDVTATAVSPEPARARETDAGGPHLGTTAPPMARSEPVALDIPSIDVHSELSSVGLNPDGSLEVPTPGPLYDLAAWYRNSPTPGELGPSVIEGHLDSVHGPSVFFRLGELQFDDEISVRRVDGSTALFRVTSAHRYAKADFPTAEVYDDITHAGLRLITCGGAIDPETGRYADNVVVYATLVRHRLR